MDLVGRTPLVYLDKFAESCPGRIAAKLEYFNPTGSVKVRIVLNMIRDAEKRGFLRRGSTIVEPTSGNTGIGLACFCAICGYKLVLTMPDALSPERFEELTAFGAELVFTPKEKGMRGAIERAEKLMTERENGFMLQQFNNTANPEAHERATGVEIWGDSGREVDFFVAGVGTGGTITGVGRYLKKRKPELRLVAVEPSTCSVLQGGKPGKHGISGIGAGFVSRVMDESIVDEIVAVNDEEARATCRYLASEEGLLVGPSSGAAAAAAKRIAKKTTSEGKLIVVLFPDGGEKYLGMGLFT